MLPLYEKIEDLCKAKDINVTQMCKEAGIARSVLSDYKTGRKKKMAVMHLEKIANYFGVTIDDLLGRCEQTESPSSLSTKDERDIARKIDELMADLEHAEGLMFDGVPMSEEAMESMRAAMKLGLEAAKLKNKEKYTPKKYRRNEDGD